MLENLKVEVFDGFDRFFFSIFASQSQLNTLMPSLEKMETKTTLFSSCCTQIKLHILRILSIFPPFPSFYFLFPTFWSFNSVLFYSSVSQPSKRSRFNSPFYDPDNSHFRFYEVHLNAPWSPSEHVKLSTNRQRLTFATNCRDLLTKHKLCPCLVLGGLWILTHTHSYNCIHTSCRPWNCVSEKAKHIMCLVLGSWQQILQCNVHELGSNNTP